MLLRFPDRSPVRPLNPPSGFWNQKKISSEYSPPPRSRLPKNTPSPVGNQHPRQNTPRESSRGCEPSRLPIEAGDLRGGKVACPKGKQVASRPTKRNRRFRLVAPGADFFGAGACPPEKKSLPCRFRARKSKGFQRNLRKGGAEGNPSPPPPGVLERAAALSTFNLRGGGSGGGSLLPRPPHKPAPPSTSRASASISLYTLDSTSTSAEKSIRGMYRDSVSSCSAFAARRQP